MDDAVLNANADHTIAARTHSEKPDVLGSEVAAKYPSYLTLDRSTFMLRLWKHLKLADLHRRGRMEGLERRKASTRSRKRKKNRSGTCRNSAWAGSLAGQDVPPGPEPDQGPLDGDL